MKENPHKQRFSYGLVVSDKMDKTVVVNVTRIVSHKLYGKVIRRVSKFKAHDETNQSKIGDKVKIVQSRPISKGKHWRVVEILEKGEHSNP